MGDTLTKRRYTVSDKVRAAGRRNLEKARAVDKKILYRRTERRLKGCRANLLKARQSPKYKPYVRNGLRAVDLRQSAPLVGETQQDYDRHMELVEAVVPASGERQQNAVRGLGQALWRRRRAFVSQAHREIRRFYQDLAQAAEEGITAFTLLFLLWGLETLFREAERLKEAVELLDRRLERVVEAYLTESAGRKISLGFPWQHPQREQFLDLPPEAIGNALVRPAEVKRRMKRKPVRLRATGQWGWGQGKKRAAKLPRLLEEWGRRGYRLPDPRCEEDFALHLRLLEAAFFGDRDSGFGLETANGTMETGQGEALASPLPLPVSHAPFPPVSPELHDAVRKLAEATWQRLQVFARQGEKEAAKLRDTLEQAEAGALRPPPRPEEAAPKRSFSQFLRQMLRHKKRLEGQGADPDGDETRAATPGEETDAEAGKEPPPPEPQWLLKRLIGGLIFSEAEQAFEAATHCHGRVEEAFGALQQALDEALPPAVDSRQ